MNKIKEIWSMQSARRLLATLPVFLILSTAILCQGCISRSEIRASIWLNNGLDPSLCGPSKAQSRFPSLWDYGFYRRLDAGGFEFISFCNPAARNWFGVHRDDLERILNETLPKADALAVMRSLGMPRRR